MADCDGWTVVRGKKGKARSTPLKRPRDECCPGEGASCGPGAAEPLAAAAGEGQPAGTGGGGGCTASGSKGGRPGRRGFRERTPQEQCAQLVSAVLACRREVEDSAFFTRLLQVLAEAAPHLAHLPDGGGPPSPTAAMMATDGAAATAPQPRPEQRDERMVGSGAGDADMGAEGGGEVAAAKEEEEADGAEGAAGLAAWRRMRGMVVYGLGSPHESRVSRYQLALVLLLRDRVLPGLRSAVQLYDPAFDDVDRLALAQLGLQALEVNEGGARRVAEPTFFYLPHCEGALCDALLAANWGGGVGSCGTDGRGGGGVATGGHVGSGADDSGVGIGGGLPLLAILGNSFKTYQERWELKGGGSGGAQEGKPRRPGRVIRCCEQGAVRELPTPDLRFPAPSAFNDMSLHVFPPSEGLSRLLAGGGAGVSGSGGSGDQAME